MPFPMSGKIDVFTVFCGFMLSQTGQREGACCAIPDRLSSPMQGQKFQSGEIAVSMQLSRRPSRREGYHDAGLPLIFEFENTVCRRLP